MKKRTKITICIGMIFAIVLVCTWLVENQRRQFDYVYLNGTYYYVTNRPADDNKKEKVQTVTENSPIDFKNKRQKEGASNILPIATVLYKAPDNKDIIFYKRPDSHDFQMAYKIYGDISSDWKVYITENTK